MPKKTQSGKIRGGGVARGALLIGGYHHEVTTSRTAADQLPSLTKWAIDSPANRCGDLSELEVKLGGVNFRLRHLHRRRGLQLFTSLIVELLRSDGILVR